MQVVSQSMCALLAKPWDLFALENCVSPVRTLLCDIKEAWESRLEAWSAGLVTHESFSQFNIVTGFGALPLSSGLLKPGIETPQPMAANERPSQDQPLDQ